MSIPVGPAPIPHACAECALRYDSVEALHRHVTADHRPAPDGLELIDALLALPEPLPGAPSPPLGPPWSADRRSGRVLRACAGPALLVWVLWTAGVPLGVLVVGTVGVAAVATALALHLWADAEARRHQGGSRGPGGAPGSF